MISAAVMFFLLGLSFGSGPCLLSCGPAIIPLIAATEKSIQRSILVYLFFSIARVAVYLLLAYLIFKLGKDVFEAHLSSLIKYFYLIGGILIISSGVALLLKSNFRGSICSRVIKSCFGGSAKPAVIMGIILGFLPCLPLVTVFSYIGFAAKSFLACILYSLSFGIGTVLSPLLLIAAGAGFIGKIFHKNSIFFRILTLFSAGVIIILGVQILLGAFIGFRKGL